MHLPPAVGATSPSLEPKRLYRRLHPLLAGIRAVKHEPASAVLAAVFDARWRFGRERPWDDDATAVVLRRLQT